MKKNVKQAVKNAIGYGTSGACGTESIEVERKIVVQCPNPACNSRTTIKLPPEKCQAEYGYDNNDLAAGVRESLGEAVVRIIEQVTTDRIVEQLKTYKKVRLGKSEFAAYEAYFKDRERVVLAGSEGSRNWFQASAAGSIEIVPTEAEHELLFTF